MPWYIKLGIVVHHERGRAGRCNGMPSEFSDLENALVVDHDDRDNESKTTVTTPEPVSALLKEERYSVWTFHEKLCIITLTGAASMLRCAAVLPSCRLLIVAQAQ